MKIFLNKSLTSSSTLEILGNIWTHSDTIVVKQQLGHLFTENVWTVHIKKMDIGDKSNDWIIFLHSLLYPITHFNRMLVLMKIGKG